MKGIYLTQEGKQEIEAKIKDLEFKTEMIPDKNNQNITRSRNQANWHNLYSGELNILKEILQSATILPVEESWKLIGENTGTFYDDDGEVLHSHFKNGVIIQPKQ
jgi:hypothetical protein